jgi:CRP-like cAMP-binding protein
LDHRLWQRHADDLRRFLDHRTRLLPAERASFLARLTAAENELAALSDMTAAGRYAGTLGVQPSLVAVP